MSFLKILTSRNAFSREYGTWLIILFNLVFVPVYLHNVNTAVMIFSLSVVFFLMFRFELLDIVATKLQFNQKVKIIRSLIYLFISVGLFLFLYFISSLPLYLTAIIIISGILMLLLNLLTRRKEGKRQMISAQFVLVTFAAFLGAMNYYFIKETIDKNFWIIFIFNSLYYANSVVYVRSKTMGAPFDVYAFLFSIMIILIIIIFNYLNIIKLSSMIIFIPTFVKTLDNIILTNIKVPLRRIGVNESVHCIIFLTLFCLLS